MAGNDCVGYETDNLVLYWIYFPTRNRLSIVKSAKFSILEERGRGGGCGKLRKKGKEAVEESAEARERYYVYLLIVFAF